MAGAIFLLKSLYRYVETDKRVFAGAGNGEPLQIEIVEDKRTILFMYFEAKLRYNHERGFRTNQLGRNIKLITNIGDPKSPDVEMEGCEPSSKNNF